MKKALVAFLLLIGIVVCFASCSMFDLGITFMVDGEKYDEIRTNGSETITMPEDPQKEGQIFVGWYFDKDVWQKPFTANSLLDTPLTSDIRVYARFVDEGDESLQATLTFNSMGGTEVDDLSIPNGAKPTQPKEPTYDGFYFCGWYTYPDYQTPFNFDEPLTKNTTVYAKWAQVGSVALADVDFEKALRVEQSVAFDSIYEQNGKTYVVYKLGTMKNVIMGQLTKAQYYAANGQTLTYTYSQGKETSVATTVEETLGVSVGATVEVSVEGGPPFAKASASYSCSVSKDQSWSESFTKAEAVYKEEDVSSSFSLDAFALGKYYAIAVVGDQDVYQYFVFDETGYTGEMGVTALEVGSPGWRILSSDTTSFTYSGEKGLTPLSEPDLSLVFGGGRGTENAPYFVGDVAQLYAIKLSPASYYKLTADINMTNVTNWTPLCSTAEEQSFSGTLNGNGKTIRGLSLIGPKSSVAADCELGLFGNISGVVKNLKFENCKIEMEANQNGNGVILAGILCGSNHGTIDGVELKKCSVTVHRDYSHTGCLVGYTYPNSKISNVSVENSFVMSNGDVGMVAGLAYSATVSGCEIKSCSVQYYAQKTNRSAGGVIGYMEGASISSCSVTNTEFWYKGSSSDMHNPILWVEHGNCPLKPYMGYIVGFAAKGSTLSASTCTAQNNTHRFDGASADDKNRITGSNTEGKAYFKAANGMAGEVSNSTVN